MTSSIENRWDLYSLAIQQKYKKPSEWRICKVSCHMNGDDNIFEFEGAVPLGVYKSGPKIGKTRWPSAKNRQTFTILSSELDKFYLQWERETGMCYCCLGKAEIARTVSSTGKTYQSCIRCKGTGKAHSH